MDVLATFEFLFTISRAFGIFPFRVYKLRRVSTLLDTKTLMRSKVMMVVFMVVQGLILLQRIEEEMDHCGPLSKKLVNILNLIVFTLGGLTMYTCVVTKTIFLRDWLNKMNTLCLLLESNHKRLQFWNRFLIFTSFLNYFGMNSPAMVQYWTTIERFDFSYEFLESLYLFVMLGVTNLFTCQFLIFTNAARFIYIQINETLRVLCRRPERLRNKGLKLQNLKAEDMFLKDYVDAVNSVYILHVFIGIFWSFLSLLYVTVDEVGRETAFPGTLHVFLWTFYLTFQMVLVLAICHTTSSEAKKTACHIHELFLDNDDPEIKEEIEILSLQLQHRKVEFNACGFFQLDFTLLYSMIGAVTTYIIILMQFQEEDLIYLEWGAKKITNCSILFRYYSMSDIYRCLNRTEWLSWSGLRFLVNKNLPAFSPTGDEHLLKYFAHIHLLIPISYRIFKNYLAQCRKDCKILNPTTHNGISGGKKSKKNNQQEELALIKEANVSQ